MFGTLLVGLGSAIGGVARYGCSLFFARLLGETFPWGTLFVNVSGSFIIGLFFTLTSAGGRLLISPDWRIFVTVGFCGGFTTFSSLSLQTLMLLRNGEWLQGGLNALGSFVFCLVAVWLGSMSAAALNHRP